MKKTYIKPITEKIEAEIVEMVCASNKFSSGNYSLNRYGQWGASSDVEYGNDAWQIEGFSGEKIGNFEAVKMGGDDYEDLSSRANEALW